MIGRSQKLRVLTAALRLPSFTSAELARAAAVPLGTARTVLAREAELFERLGAVAERRRGGRFQRYRVHPRRVRSLWRAVDDALGSRRPAPPSRRAPARDAIADLMEALVLLGPDFDGTTDPAHAIALAELALADCARRFAEDRGALGAATRLLDGLLALREQQVAARASPEVSSSLSVAIRDAVLALLDPRGAPRRPARPQAEDASGAAVPRPPTPPVGPLAGEPVGVVVEWPDVARAVADPASRDGTDRASRYTEEREGFLRSRLGGLSAARTLDPDVR